MRLDHTRAGERVAAEAQAAALRAADGVRGLIGGLEGQTQNATANPRLVAALDANVDQETLRDLLLTEPWWEPFRRGVDGFGLYADENTRGRDVAAAGAPSTRARWCATRTRDTTPRRSAGGGGTGAGGGGVPGGADRPFGLAGAGLDPDPRRRPDVRDGGARGRRRRDLRRAAAARRGDDRRRRRRRRSGGAEAGGRSAGARLARARRRRPWRRCRCPAAVCACWSASPRPSSHPGGMPLPWSALAILIIGLAFSIGLYVMLVAARVRTPRSRRWCPPPRPTRRVASIGRYTIVERIGQGGMAEIYAAVTQGEGSFRRPVVIKRLRPELTIDPNAVAQFCDEANLLAALHHPNIVAVHDFGRSQGQYFLAEEYVVGRDLGRVVERRFAQAHQPPPIEVHRLRRRRAAEGAGVRARPDQRDGPAAGHRAPRRLARERHGVRAGRGEAARLRRGQGGRRARRAHRDRAS